MCEYNAIYWQWYNQIYDSELHPSLIQQLVLVDRSNKKLWKAMNFDERTASFQDFLDGKLSPQNGEIMDASGILCRQSLRNLERGLAGTHLDLDTMNQGIHDTMCSVHCLTSDKMRIAVMNITGCSCSELSTTPVDELYKESGDWCKESSGQYLCDEIGNCGKWKCTLDDFECKRKEYNTMYVPLKGYGNDCSSSINSHLIEWGVIGFLLSAIIFGI
jgi:hypothetical protein